MMEEYKLVRCKFINSMIIRLLNLEFYLSRPLDYYLIDREISGIYNAVDEARKTFALYEEYKEDLEIKCILSIMNRDIEVDLEKPVFSSAVIIELLHRFEEME